MNVKFSEFTNDTTPDSNSFFVGYDIATNANVRVSLANLSSAIGGFTSGSVLFAGPSGTLTQDNANLFWNDTNNRLGIGTSSPSFTLDVSGTLRATSNINTPFLYSSGELYLGYSGGSTGILIKTSGSVCIGVDASIAKLHIKGSGTTSATTGLLVQNSAGTQILKLVDDGVLTIGRTDFINWTFSSNTLSSSQYAFVNSNNGSILSTGASNGGVFGNNNGGKIADSGITTPQLASSVLEVSSTSKGFLPPRMTTAQRDAIVSPAAGLEIYNTTTNVGNFFNGTVWGAAGAGGSGTAGKATKWTSASAIGDSLLFDNGTSVWGTGAGAIATNTAFGNLALITNTTGASNTAFGYEALKLATNSEQNTAIGYQALKATLSFASQNTAIGSSALSANTTGNANVAVGALSLMNNTGGTENTAIGYAAMMFNATGSFNVAIGWNSNRNGSGSNNITIGNKAGQTFTTASNNVAIGQDALTTLNGGSNNVGVGHFSLKSMIGTQQNVAIGALSMQNKTGGNGNLAVGYQALGIAIGGGDNNVALGTNSLKNNTASENMAVGANSLAANTTGTANVAIGASALLANTTASQNTANGYAALVTNSTGSQNTAIGNNSMRQNQTGSQNAALGLFSMFNNTTGTGNTACGVTAQNGNTVGNYNTVVGWDAQSTNFNESVVLGASAAATASNQFVVGAVARNAGTVTAEVNASANVWNVVINGVARKILLA